MKICYIEECYQCRHCGFDSEYAYDNEGWCNKLDREIDNVCSMPEWCELEDKKGDNICLRK